MAEQRLKARSARRYKGGNANEAVRAVDVAISRRHALYEVFLASKRGEVSEQRQRGLDRDERRAWVARDLEDARHRRCRGCEHDVVPPMDQECQQGDLGSLRLHSNCERIEVPRNLARWANPALELGPRRLFNHLHLPHGFVGLALAEVSSLNSVA